MGEGFGNDSCQKDKLKHYEITPIFYFSDLPNM